MSLDIFSTFDDHNKTIFRFFYLVWLLVLIFIVRVYQNFWFKFNVKFSINCLFIQIAKDLYQRVLGNKIGGVAVHFSVLIIILVRLNLLGLRPYVFSLTSHLVVNFSISLPIWMSVLLIRLSFNAPSFVSHLQPLGSPSLLNPFLCIIELVRLLVRPLTLAVRLTANLSTGHILIGLLGGRFIRSIVPINFFVLFLGIFYFIFEIGVCVIQAYIFTLLPTLYSDEHPDNW